MKKDFYGKGRDSQSEASSQQRSQEERASELSSENERLRAELEQQTKECENKQARLVLLERDLQDQAHMLELGRAQKDTARRLEGEKRQLDDQIQRQAEAHALEISELRSTIELNGRENAELRAIVEAQGHSQSNNKQLETEAARLRALVASLESELGRTQELLRQKVCEIETGKKERQAFENTTMVQRFAIASLEKKLVQERGEAMSPEEVFKVMEQHGRCGQVEELNLRLRDQSCDLKLAQDRIKALQKEIKILHANVDSAPCRKQGFRGGA